MKYLLTLFAFIAFQSFAQDAILKKDGSKIDAKVIEISSTTIKYRKWDQPDGPMRTIEIREVKEIIYNDGTWEKFDEETTPKTEEKESPMRPPSRDDSRNDQDKEDLFKNGIFLDGVLGVGLRNYSYLEQIYTPNIDPNTGYDLGGTTTEQETRYSETNFMLSIRLGSKWYFGQGEKWRPGLQVTWFRFGTYIGGEAADDGPLIAVIGGPKTFSICNVGYANIFKFTDQMGLEANVTGGYNLEMYPYDGILTHGVSATVEAKFRFKKLAVGIDYMHIFGIENETTYNNSVRPASFNNIGISIGGKF